MSASIPDYLDFDLEIARGADTGSYVARVIDSPKGEASASIVMPFVGHELENVILKLGRTRSGVRKLASPSHELAKTFGSSLYDAVFADEVGTCFRRSLDEAENEGKGLRVRLRLTGVPELADIPWEYLYPQGLRRFLVLSSLTPVVRYLELPRELSALRVESPLKVLLVVSSPRDLATLDTAAEIARIDLALGAQLERGQITVTATPNGTLSALRAVLRHDTFHVLHFIGHGGFDPTSGEGMLAFEDDHRTSHLVSGADLATLLHDHRSLRLAVLNACEGARQSPSDPFSGVAQSLVQQGMPAVVAMQFEITDVAATAFSQEFYASIADGYPIDAALAQARLAVFSEDNDVEWGTPVLYLRARDGRIFDVTTPAAGATPSTPPTPVVVIAPVEPPAVGEVSSATESAPATHEPSTVHTEPAAATHEPSGVETEPAAATHEPSGVETEPAPEAPPPMVDPDAVLQPTVPDASPTVHADPAPVGPATDTRPVTLTGPQPPSGASSQDHEHAPPQRRRWLVAALVALLMTGVVGVALRQIIGSDTPVANPTASVTPPVTPTTPSRSETAASRSSEPSSPSPSSSTSTPPFVPLPVISVPMGSAVIDGDASEWGPSPQVRSTARVFGTASGVSATWQLRWDVEALYLLGEAQDSTPAAPDPANPDQAWRGDSLSFELGRGNTDVTLKNLLRKRDRHYLFGITETPPGVVQAVNVPDSKKVDFNPGITDPRISAAMATTADGYRIEMRVPWQVADLGPVDKGSLFAGNFNISDRGAGGKLGAMYSSNPNRTEQHFIPSWQLIELVS